MFINEQLNNWFDKKYEEDNNIYCEKSSSNFKLSKFLFNYYNNIKGKNLKSSEDELKKYNYKEINSIITDTERVLKKNNLDLSKELSITYNIKVFFNNIWSWIIDSGSRFWEQIKDSFSWIKNKLDSIIDWFNKSGSILKRMPSKFGQSIKDLSFQMKSDGIKIAGSIALLGLSVITVSDSIDEKVMVESLDNVITLGSYMSEGLGDILDWVKMLIFNMFKLFRRIVIFPSGFYWVGVAVMIIGLSGILFHIHSSLMASAT